ncbi:hypothetical protein [Chamaesiphon sp. VAR_48_metabat_135_sub]|uniref:hypothetical protein n=1 Tax=Chamaesiphon sp. VAR_48_metabat_135_sub TaxID=2964699 RepID=UPI00286A2070|nr:hypothetical protein [Chamaesiphon sp. VAR_48_metabat_135_sub]
MHNRLERIESVKAGSLGGIAAGMSYCLMMTVERFVLVGSFRSIVSLGLELAIAIVSGFLFGVTYRYIIRIDRNDHLNSGAVLAFGLVRGLAQVDVSEFELSQIWMDGLIVGKSILLFAIARYALDYSLAKGLVLSFPQHSQSESIAGSNRELEREFATNLIDGLNK